MSESVHLFAGQGDFSLSRLVSGLTAQAALRRAVLEVFGQVDEVAARRGLPMLTPWLTSDSPPSGRDLAAFGNGLEQLALFGASMSVHAALRDRYGAPGAVVGVSFGEIAALTAAGVFTVADGAGIAHDLARILATCPGGLSLLGCDERAATALIAGTAAPDVAVACVNDDTETIVSGPVGELAHVEQRARAEHVRAVRLRLPFGSHHRSLTDQAEQFAAAVREYRCAAPRTVVFSAVAGRAYGSGDDVARALADCLTRPARLPDVLARLGAHRDAEFFEAGTGSALADSVRRVLSDPHTRVTAPMTSPDFFCPAALP